MPNVFDSSTVMTPSLPTLSMASAISAPISGSAAEMAPTLAISSLVSTSLDWFLMASTASSVARSMPRLSAIGLAPAATLRRPSFTMACARTVAVVVPSPATSSVFLATSLTSSAPIFSLRVLELDLLGDGYTVVGDRGSAPLLLQDDVATLGAERDLDRVGQLVHATLEGASGFLVDT